MQCVDVAGSQRRARGVLQAEQDHDAAAGAFGGLGSPAVRGGVTIRLRFFAELIEARVAIPGLFRPLGVHLLEIAENGFHRGMETVEIEAIKAGSLIVRRERVVAGA